MCYMTYFNTAMHFMAMSEATKINFFGLENFCLLYIHCTYFAFSCWSFWCAAWPTLTLLCTSWPWPRPPRSTSWGWRTFSCCTLHLLCLFMLIVLMCCMTYFNTAIHFMDMSEVTKINFLSQEYLGKLTTFSSLLKWIPNASEKLFMHLMPWVFPSNSLLWATA